MECEAADGTRRNCRLILSDMDQTILPWGAKTVSGRTRAAFHAALRAGIPIGPASGRALSWVPPMFSGDASCCQTAVATNGLEIWLEGTCIHHELFSHQALEALADELAAHHPGAGLLLFGEEGPTLALGTREGLAKTFPAYAETARETGRIPEGAVTKANVFEELDRPKTQKLVNELNGAGLGLDFDLAFAGYLNAMPHGWNKGKGIEVLCAALGISADEVVVFGDANNDLAMFGVAANSVAVANATPEAARAARWHIGRCEDDAVAAAIEELVEGRWPFVS